MRRPRARISYYDRPASSRITQQVFDGLFSAAILFFLQPVLVRYLAPLREQVTREDLKTEPEPSNPLGTS